MNRFLRRHKFDTIKMEGIGDKNIKARNDIYRWFVSALPAERAAVKKARIITGGALGAGAISAGVGSAVANKKNNSPT